MIRQLDILLISNTADRRPAPVSGPPRSPLRTVNRLRTPAGDIPAGNALPTGDDVAGGEAAGGPPPPPPPRERLRPRPASSARGRAGPRRGGNQQTSARRSSRCAQAASAADTL